MTMALFNPAIVIVVPMVYLGSTSALPRPGRRLRDLYWALFGAVFCTLVEVKCDF